MSAAAIILILVLGISLLLVLRSWTVMETIISVSGLLLTLLVSVFV